MEAPLGGGEDVAGGDFEEDGLDGAVVVVGGLVGQTLHEAVDGVCDEEMLVVDEVDGGEGLAGYVVVGGGLNGEGVEREC